MTGRTLRRPVLARRFSDTIVVTLFFLDLVEI
jgi:hypothetical protein